MVEFTRRTVGGVLVLFVLVTAGVFVAVEHPLAELGVTATPGTAFATVDARADAYTERSSHRIVREGEVTRDG